MIPGALADVIDDRRARPGPGCFDRLRLAIAGEDAIFRLYFRRELWNTTPLAASSPMGVPNDEFEKVVTDLYQDLYRFAFSLAKNEADAVDLTQQTFYRFATKGDSIRDKSKTKSWLFRTLKNDFLSQARRSQRFQHVALEDAATELPGEEAGHGEAVDGQLAVDALQDVEETYRVTLSLFYMKGLSYKEIAETLEIPIGTVMSRLSRGKTQLRNALSRASRGVEWS